MRVGVGGVMVVGGWGGVCGGSWDVDSCLQR